MCHYISFRTYCASGRVSDLTWLFHHVNALLVKVHEEKFTLLASEHAQISKIDSIFSNHQVRAMTPPLTVTSPFSQIEKIDFVYAL